MMRKQLLLAIVCVLALSASAYAGPFGIFGKNRQQASGCSGAGCQTQQSSSSFQQSSTFQQTFSAAPVTRTVVVPSATTILQTGPAVLGSGPTVLPLKGAAMPELPPKLTINGVDYFRH